MKNHSSTSRHLTLIFAWVFVALAFAAPALAQYTIREVPPLYTDVWDVKINATGQAAGYGNTPNGNAAFFYDGTNLVQLSLGGTYSQALDINDSGEVIGYAYLPGNAAQHAFLYSGGVVNDLNALIPANSGWVLTQATAINNAGQIVGTGILNNQQRGFLYTPAPGGGTIVDLGTLGGTTTYPRDINSSGQVVGYSYLSNNSSHHAFLYTNGVMTDLGTLGGSYSEAVALNDAGQATGWGYTSNNNFQHAFRYSSGTMTDLGTFGGTYSYGAAINASGQVVGLSYTLNNNSYHPFLYTNSLVDLGTLGGQYGDARAINDAGVVTGWAQTNNQQHAFRYSGGTMQDLNALVSACSGREIYYGQSINNAGQIAGRGFRPGVNFAYVLSPGSPPSVQPTTLGARQVTGSYNTFVTLTADLSADACGVSGATVDFSLTGQPPVSATTDANGFAYATVNLAGINAGFHPDAIAASYSGDATHTAATDTADLTIQKAIPNISWSQPAAITYGTPLGAAELNATADAPGTFMYSPPAGTILPGGTHAITAVFTPTDTTNYASPVSRSVPITVTGAQPPFVSSDLGTLGGTYSAATAINDAGQATGWSYTSSNQFQHVFRYSNGTMTDLGALGGTWAYPAAGINASGQIAGYGYTPNNNGQRAFLSSNTSLIDLGTLGGPNSEANALNDSGQVTGWAHTASNQQHAFRYTNGVMIDLGTLGGSSSYPNAGINAAGQVAGYSYVANNTSHHAFLYTTSMIDLGTFGGPYSYATDLNDAGQVTGYAQTTDNQWHAFLYSGGVLTDLGTLGGLDSYGIAINSSGQVAGHSRVGDSYHAFLATNGQMTDLGTLGGSYSQATAINDAGDVIGHSSTPYGEQHGFLYRNGTMIDLGTLGGGYTYVNGMNAAGDVTGYSLTAYGEYHAFLYRAGVMTDLGTFGGTQSIPLAINSSGQVAGYSHLSANSSYHAFIATPNSDATTLSVIPVTGTFGGSISLSATLKVSSTQAPLATRTIQLYLNGTSVGSAVTNGSGVATLNNASLSGISSGSYPTGVKAVYVGEQNYSPSTGLAALTVNSADQTITFGALAGKTYGDADFSVSASSTSGLAVSFSVVSGNCLVTGSSVHITGAGSCTIRASQVGDGNYNAATDVDQPFTIAKADQTISFGALAGKTFLDPDFTIGASASSSLSVSFSVVSGQCTVSGTTVHLTGAGGCTIRASQGGDANYTAAADVDQPFAIAKANQTITFGALANKTFGDADFTVSASSTSNLAVSFSAASGQCSTSGTTVSLTGAGACTIRASQPGNNDYNAAPDVDQPFTIGKGSQTITIGTAVPATAIYNASFATAATGGGSGMPVAITASGACAVTSGGSGNATIQMTSGIGTCAVSYTQNGDANYYAAPSKSGSTTAQKAAQTIVVITGAPPTATFGSSFTVAATGGGSGNPVTYTSPATNDGCSDVGPTFNVVNGTNNCQILYNQAGNNNYDPAPTVTQPVNVVGYAFTGFFQPIDMPVGTTPVWNTATAGQAIPAKWQLTLNGNVVSSLSSYAGMYSVEVACGSGTGALEDAIEEYAPGASTITYDGNGNFHINWKTLTTYKGKCRAFYVSFNDGSTSKVAYFKFK